ncbi:MAG: hypothetical protein ABSG79_07360 [Bryobacteraceae bacterium]|jgi:hypothetical protein
MQPGVAAQNAAVAVLDSHLQVEESVQRLRQSGFDLSKLSVVAKDRHPEQQVVAHYGADRQAKYWGEFGPFWTGMWASLSGWAYLVIPDTGPILVAGPLSGWIVAALDNQAVFGGLSALGAALYSLGIPKDAVLRNEAAVRMDKLLLIAHGAVDEVGKAREIMR